MNTSWVIVTDSTRARIFEKKGANEPLMEFEDLVDPAAFENKNELEHHTRGRYHDVGTGHSHTDDPSVSPLAHQNDLFAKSIALYLDKGRKDSKFHRLYLITFSLVFNEPLNDSKTFHRCLQNSKGTPV